MFDQQPPASPGGDMLSGLDADLTWPTDHVCDGCPSCDPDTYISADEVYLRNDDRQAAAGAGAGDSQPDGGDAVAEALFFPEEPVVADPRSVAQADAEVAGILAAGPSGQAAVELVTLTPGMLSVAGRMDLIAAWQAQEAWAAAQTAACLAEHLGAEPDGPVMDAHTIEVDHEVLGWRMLLGETATVLRMAEGTLHRRYRIAWALSTRLPATRQALQAGHVGWLYALAVAEATELLTDDQAAQVDEAVMRNPGRLSVATLRRRLRRAVIAADPDAAVAKARKAHADRGVRTWSDPVGDSGGHPAAGSGRPGHPGRAGRPPRTRSRLRAGPGRHRPRLAHRRHQLAASGDRPGHRAPARLRTHRPVPPSQARAVLEGAGCDVCVPRLRSTGYRV